MPVAAVRSTWGAVLCGLLLILAACSSNTSNGGSSQPTNPPPTTRSTQIPPTQTPNMQPAACRQWSCQPRQTVQLPAGYQVRLWLSADQRNFRSRPVVELLHDGMAAQYWVSPKGDGWNGSLTCLTGDAGANCVLIDTLGIHSNVGEVVLVQDGRLIHPVDAEVMTDSVGMRAADLDGDGDLDIIGVTNDYQPNYAQGHNYWQTFRYGGGLLTETGCALQRPGAPAPTQLLSGACPTM
jgi:hypothetical protein